LAMTSQQQIAALNESLNDITDDVESLQGGPESGKVLSRIFAGTTAFGFRRFCEFFAMAEVMDACLFFGFSNPDPYWIHLDCGPISEGFVEPCPELFWKMEVGCYRPNFPRYGECSYDPLPRNETCTRLLYLSCTGYATELAENWMKMDWDVTG